jgi:hypothetical protein
MEDKKREYQKRIPEERKRKTRYFIANDLEWNNLKAKAEKDNLSHSEYIIKRLKLDKE